MRNDPTRSQIPGILAVLLLSLISAIAAPAPDDAAAHFVVITNTSRSSEIDLQAMLNAAPHSTNRNSPGGITIELGEGIFYTGGAVWTNRTLGVDTIVIKGQGVVQTCLVFTNNSGLDISGKNNRIGVEIRGLLIASTVDSNYFLVHLQNNNRTIIDDVTFHYWPTATNIGIGLQVGLVATARCANGLGGLWYDCPGTYGDAFVVQNCNFDALVVGALLDGNHPRLYNNFFEGINRGGGHVGQAANTWPVTDALHIGGALFLGHTLNTAPIQSFTAIGNHWFNCSNAIVDLKGTDDGPLGELRFIDSQFEFGQSVLMLTNSPHRLFFDGFTYSPPVLRNFTTDFTTLDSTGQNANFRLRTSDHFYGSWQFDAVSSANFSGNGAGLTNLVANADPAQIAAVANAAIRTNAVSTTPVFSITNGMSIGTLDLKALFSELPSQPGGPVFGGGSLGINGAFYVSTNCFLLTNWFSFDLHGVAEGHSMLIITNWDGTSPALSFSSSPGDGNHWRGRIRDLGIFVLQDCTNSILFIDHNAKVSIEHCQVGLYKDMTNADGEAGGGAGHAANTIGIEIQTKDGQQESVDDVNLFGNHIGMVYGGDHLRVSTLLVESCGNSTSTLWPRGDLRSIGCGVMFLSGSIQDSVIIGLHPFRTPWAVVNAITNAGSLNFFGGDFGEVGNRSLTVRGSATTLNFIGEKSWSGRTLLADQMLDLAGGKWTVTAEPAPVIDQYAQAGTHVLAVGNRPKFGVSQTDITLVTNTAALQNFGANAYYGTPRQVVFIFSPNDPSRSFLEGYYTNTPAARAQFRNGTTNGLAYDPDYAQFVLVPTNFFGNTGLSPFAYVGSGKDYPYYGGQMTDQNSTGQTIYSDTFYIYDQPAQFPNGLVGNGAGLTNLVANADPAQIAAIAATNESSTAPYVVITNTVINHNIDLPAMLNALPHAANRMYPGGGTIELGEGIFYTSGALYTNYSGVDSITIKGKGGVQTCLVFTNNTGLTFRGSGNNIGLHLQGLLIASTVDSNYFLVHLQNNNRTIIEDCSFGYWPHMTNGIGLELGVIGGAQSVNGLGGVWYDGVPNPLGAVFILARNNFNALAIGAYLNANHPRIEDNFFEADNCDGNPEQPSKTSNWPATSPLSLGGAIFLGPNISSFSGRGNHWFRCVNPIVDLRRNALNEVIFRDNEFELCGGGILMITNGTAALNLDGITYAEPNLALYETNIVSGYSLSATSFDSLPNPNYRSRTGGHYRGNYDFQPRPASAPSR